MGDLIPLLVDYPNLPQKFQWAPANSAGTGNRGCAGWDMHRVAVQNNHTVRAKEYETFTP